MAAPNSDNVRAGITGGVRVADSGTTAPTDATTAYAAGWRELGYLSEDGVTETNDADVTEFRAWQNGTVVRRYASGSSVTFGFTCIETNYDVLQLFYPGSTIATTGGNTTLTVKSPTPQRKAFAFDVVDGESTVRIVVPRGEITERGDITYQNGEVTGYEFTLTAYPDADNTVMYKYFTDDAVAAPA